jgi:choline kinase
MQAIILAAGRGSRLATATQGKPKCLVQVESISLIEYQLTILENFGITDVCVVLGYRAHEVYRLIGDRCHCAINRRYAETNSLYSLWLARNWIEGDCLIMNSDILAHPKIYQRLLKTSDNALVYDSWSGTDREETKVILQQGRLEQIDKNLSITDSQGESVGLLKFTKRGIKALLTETETALALAGENQWITAGIARLAQRKTIAAIDIAGLPWIEIDFPEDLQQARQNIWPLIAPDFFASLPSKQYQVG